MISVQVSILCHIMLCEYVYTCVYIYICMHMCIYTYILIAPRLLQGIGMQNAVPRSC